jgi:two-component system chemotaxis response regulator CheB
MRIAFRAPKRILTGSPNGSHQGPTTRHDDKGHQRASVSGDDAYSVVEHFAPLTTSGTIPMMIRGAMGSIGLHRIYLFGGSSGSLDPLRKVLSAFSPDLPATVFVVLHLASNQRCPTVLIAQHTALEVRLAEDGIRFLPGKVYMAPSDRHLALEGDVMRVFRGPRENRARPAIDVLFRSAAVHHGPRVTAVVLSGYLGDGSQGLVAVHRCGGISIVQEPGDSLNSEMPRRALQATVVDHCVPASEIGGLLLNIASLPGREGPRPPEDLQAQAHTVLHTADRHASIETLNREAGPGDVERAGELGGCVIADERAAGALRAPQLLCPQCNDPLSQAAHWDGHAYCCHVGHRYTVESMLAEHSLVLEGTLWMAFRTLKERGALLQQLEEQARAQGLSLMAQDFRKQRAQLDQYTAAIHRALAVFTNAASHGPKSSSCTCSPSSQRAPHPPLPALIPRREGAAGPALHQTPTQPTRSANDGNSRATLRVPRESASQRRRDSN